MTVLRLTGLALLALCATAGLAAELAVPRIPTAPQIDGRLDEECWRAPAPITEFRCVDKERSVPTQATQAWVAWDDEALYVAVRCADDRMAQVPATVTERDGPVWQDDCLEVFLMPGAPYFYHFAANLLGAHYDARGSTQPSRDEPVPANWSSEWQSAARREADHWTMEIAIPCACLEWGAARLAGPLKFNIGREQRRLAEFSCWPASGFNKTDEFATLTGVQLDPKRYGLHLSEVQTGGEAPGMNRYSAVISEDAAPGVMTVEARVRSLPEGAEQVFTKQVTSVPGGRVELDYQVPLSGGKVSAVFDCRDARGKLRATRTGLWWVPAPVEAKLDLPLLYRSDGQVRLAGKVMLRGEGKLQARLMRDGKAVASQPVSIGADGAFEVRMPVRNLPPGRYAIETRLTTASVAEPVVNEYAFRLIAGPLD